MEVSNFSPTRGCNWVILQNSVLLSKNYVLFLIQPKSYLNIHSGIIFLCHCYGNTRKSYFQTKLQFRTLLNMTHSNVLNDSRQKQLTELNKSWARSDSQVFLVHTKGPCCSSVTLVLHGIKIRLCLLSIKCDSFQLLNYCIPRQEGCM